MVRKIIPLNKLFLILFLLMIAMILAITEKGYEDQKNASDKKNSHIKLDIDPNTLIAKSVFVLDTSNGEIIYTKNSRELLPIASITKIMTAITALNLFDENEKIRSMSNPEYNQENYMGTFLINNEVWKLSKLIEYMLIESSNEAAESIENHANIEGINFIEEMNKNSKYFRIWNTKFINSSGLDINETEAGAYSTAEDVVFLFKNALQRHKKIFETTQFKGYNVSSENGTIYSAQNTNLIISELNGIYASKTGYTELAQGNLVFAIKTESNRIIIACVLASTQNGRFEDAKKITEEIHKKIK